MTNRVSAERHYTFLGFVLRPGMAGNWPERIPIRDEDGTYIYRERTAQYVGVPRQPKAAAA